jgi:hypothetical protein
MAAIYSQQELTKQAFREESDYLRISSPLFSELARSCAEDDDIAQLVSAAARPGQPIVLLLCVVQYLLFRSPREKLAGYFPSITATPGPASEAFPVFREFCLDRHVEVMELLAGRTVNTNLVEKASSLLPGARHVSRLVGEPLTLLEICCSAGMNLMFDEYHYDYGPWGQVGAADSPVRLQCKVIGSGRPPIDAIPRIERRVGVDLVKMDPASPLDRLWMEAVLYPEWNVERERLRAALSIRVKHDVKTLIGDALEVVPPLLEELPGSLCVLLSYCLGQWSATAKVELDEMLRRASRQRDIHRLDIDMLHNESPQTIRGRLAKLASNAIPLRQKSFPSRIEHTWYAKGDAQARVLAHGDGFGVWIDWRAPET